MALNIKDPEAVRLAAEVAAITGESKTRAIRVSLQERRQRLTGRTTEPDRECRLRDFLEREAWPQVPGDVLGRPLSRAERELALGYGPEGV